MVWKGNNPSLFWHLSLEIEPSYTLMKQTWKFHFSIHRIRLDDAKFLVPPRSSLSRTSTRRQLNKPTSNLVWSRNRRITKDKLHVRRWVSPIVIHSIILLRNLELESNAIRCYNFSSRIPKSICNNITSYLITVASDMIICQRIHHSTFDWSRLLHWSLKYGNLFW